MMSVEEARKVRWLRNNPKPLGKLMDEGYLDQKRLGWAVAHAYDPNLQQAAKVLLETQEQSTNEQKTVPILPSPSPVGSQFPLGLALKKPRLYRGLLRLTRVNPWARLWKESYFR